MFFNSKHSTKQSSSLAILLIFAGVIFCKPLCELEFGNIENSFHCTRNYVGSIQKDKRHHSHQADNREAKDEECCKEQTQFISISANQHSQPDFAPKLFLVNENFISFRTLEINPKLNQSFYYIDDPPTQLKGYQLRVSIQSFLL